MNPTQAMQGCVILAAALALSASVALAETAPRGDAAHGKQIFVSYGCYECHGYQGQGANAGSRLAPDPLPLEAVVRQLRNPRGRMPVYTRKTAPDQDVADIHAYLSSIPKAKAVADIPLLAGLR